jgi:beta-lactamase regulating signal transducer with metallopeptidase domain
MISVSEAVLNYVVNATWQIAVITLVAALGSVLLKHGPSRYRHILWLAALALCVAVPLLNAAPRATAVPFVTSTSGTTPSATAPSAVAANQSRSDVPSLDSQTPLGRLNTEPDWRIHVVTASSQTTLWLTLAYALFITWRVIRLLRFWRRKEKLRSSASLTALTPVAERAAQRCRSIFKIKNVAVAQSSARTPYTIGARKPLIVLPEAFSTADEDCLLSVLGHEMAHVARRDYLVNFICELALLPISFHPLSFLIKRQIDCARELACDELVSKRLLPPKLYARSLIWAADVSSQPHTQALMLSMFDARSLEERIMRLTRNQKMLGRSTAKALASITMGVLCAAAVALSLFSLEMKTDARAIFTPTAAITNTTPAGTPSETTRAQEPRAERQQPRSETRLDAPDAQQRAEAACAAGRNGEVEKIPTLIAMLSDDTKIKPLRCWDVGRWSPALETFKHPSPGEQAAIALASMGHPAFQPLTNQLDSANATVRRNAAWAIGELTNMPPGERDGAVPRLITLLTDSDSWVRMASARALGELRHRSAVPALIANLADEDMHVRELAIWALSELKDRSAVPALCHVLVSDQPVDLRRGAADALGEIRDAEALPFLRQVLDDPAVRGRAQWAISEIEGD